MRRITMVLATCAVLSVWPPQGSMRAQSGAVTFYDLATLPGAPYGPYPEARFVVTQANSFGYATVPEGYHQTPHYHAQEQFTISVGGALDYSIGGVPHRLGGSGAAVPPSNVLHGVSNDGPETAMLIEFQPVRRADWIPPHLPSQPQPQSPQPMALPADSPVPVDFSLTSAGWRVQPTGARLKVLTGKTIRASFWDMSAAGALVDLTSAPMVNERFVFVREGQLAVMEGATRREVGPKMLVVVAPGAKNVSLRSLGKEPAEVFVFEALTPSAAATDGAALQR